MVALSKGLTTLRNLIATCMAYLHPDKDLTFIDSKSHTRDQVTLSNNVDLTVQENLRSAEIQYPTLTPVPYQHQIVNRHPTLSMDEPRLSSLSYNEESTLSPPSTQFAFTISSISNSFTSTTYSQSPVRRIPLDKGVIVNMPWYGNYRIENYKCVLYRGQPFIQIEGLRMVAPSHISTAKLLIPWETFEISPEILGRMECMRIKFWYFTILIRRSFTNIHYYLHCVNDEESMIGSDG